MSKSNRRNTEALVMILSGKGRKQVFKDKRSKRAKDARKSWQRDQQSNG